MPAQQQNLDQRVKLPNDTMALTNSDGEGDGTSFWNVNIGPSHHTDTCPDYLEYAFKNEKDRRILSTPDNEYRVMTWPEVQQLIRDNRLDGFVRVPSDLRRYREYCAQLTREHGSIMKFVMKERLKWTDLEPQKGRMFEVPSDYKVLLNDWPYGIDKRIKHLVVWVKFDLPVDPGSEKGDLTSEARREIDDYVEETFVRRCGNDNVIWFKNWSTLKSIHAVEHFHVMLFDPDSEFVKEITHGDVALAEKVGKPNQT